MIEHVSVIGDENVQTALNCLLCAVDQTRNNDPKYNHIIALSLIRRTNCTDMFGRSVRDGLVVRVVWSDCPDRDDCYYDIYVDGCNCFGVLSSVWKWLDKKL